MVGIYNDAALGARNALNSSQRAVQTSQERMASGLRINSAADDAAGSALISQFAAQIAGNSQGARNLSDGISLVQTAAGGVSQVNDAVQRIRELSVQSLNGTLSDSDRASLQAEVSELQEQVSQTVDSTSFNGVQLLSQDGNLSLQAGADSTDSIRVETSDVQGQLKALGFGSIDISTAAGAANALDVLDKSSEYISGIQGTLGASQNRFETAVSNLEQSNLNAAAARSRIADTDYARASAENARNQIKEQASIAMLGQANASSQLVLQLLGKV